MDADALGDVVFVDAALLAGAAVLLGAHVVLEGELVVEQDVDGVRDVLSLDRFRLLELLLAQLALYTRKRTLFHRVHFSDEFIIIELNRSCSVVNHKSSSFFRF